MDEIIDIVDEEDKVIGQRGKYEVHEKELLHRVSVIIIFKDSSEKEFLIQKRGLTISNEPGLFAFTAGHIGAGESYETGALRELQEEMFVDSELPNDLKLEYLFKEKAKFGKNYEYKGVFKTVYSGPFKKDDYEVESFEFVTIESLKESIKNNPQNYTKTTKLVFKKYLEKYVSD